MKLWLSFLILIILCAGVYPGEMEKDLGRLKKTVNRKYKKRVPLEWGENVTGVCIRLKTDEQVLALTLDACGSANDGYDSELIEYLVSENIPAALFINSRWIDKNKETFLELAKNPLFKIANHGAEHKPCTITGQSVYNIKGTGSIDEVIDEIEKNGRKIEELTGTKPKYYRSGTAYYDEIGVEIAEELGYLVAGFDVLGDAGASYPAEKVKEAFLSAKNGSIIIAHMNHPEKETAEGIKLAVPELKKMGFRFVLLSDYSLVKTNYVKKMKPDSQ